MTTLPTDPFREFIERAFAAGQLASLPEVAVRLGPGLREELAYLLAALRARFPNDLPGAAMQIELAFPIELAADDN